MPPTGVELWVSNGLYALFALFFTAFAGMNIFGEKFGSLGARFIYEMDEIMGGLLGILSYSKYEGILLGCSAVGMWTVLLGDSFTSIVVYSAIIVEGYLVLCVAPS